jgi:hypothetical protein
MRKFIPTGVFTYALGSRSWAETAETMAITASIASNMDVWLFIQALILKSAFTAEYAEERCLLCGVTAVYRLIYHISRDTKVLQFIVGLV